MHIIFDGPPASAKSMFLLQMQKKLEDTYYVDCTNASGPGMVEYLFKNDVKYLLLDEVEKMSKNDQHVLLRDMLSIGRLSKTIDDVDFVVTTLEKYKRGRSEKSLKDEPKTFVYLNKSSKVISQSGIIILQLWQ